MKPIIRTMASAAFVAGSLLALHPSQAQTTGFTRHDLLQHDFGNATYLVSKGKPLLVIAD